MDGISWRILLEDLEVLLAAIIQGEELCGSTRAVLTASGTMRCTVWSEQAAFISKSLLAAGSKQLCTVGVDKAVRREVKVKDTDHYSTAFGGANERLIRKCRGCIIPR